MVKFEQRNKTWLQIEQKGKNQVHFKQDSVVFSGRAYRICFAEIE